MIEEILWVLFVLICILVSVIILLQEGKGGGLAEAFGGLGAQTFGVKAEGITKFTGYLAGAVVLLAIVITRLRSGDTAVTLAPEGGLPAQPEVGVPAEPAGDEGAPAQPAETTPPAGGGGEEDGNP